VISFRIKTGNHGAQKQLAVAITLFSFSPRKPSVHHRRSVFHAHADHD
jgi:hypothetical protein